MEIEEVEVKFHLENPERVRNRLVRANAEAHGRRFEHNVRFDDDAGSLRASGRLLRIRRDGGCRLTYKEPSEVEESEFKVHREWEVTASDCGALAGILKGLGFSRTQVYEKYRETFVLGDTKLLIDTMPYGVFLELEGPRDSLRKIASDLRLDWSRRITLNYLSMFDILRQAEGLEFDDVTFENFEGMENVARKHLDRLEAGERDG
ncbi:MAG: class IV adenylate cyclase [Desulfatibacillaceae bacterium]